MAPNPAGSASPIMFYGVTDPFGAFSNFARYPIVVDGLRWLTVEHYYQAQKFADEATREVIRHAGKAMAAARLGRERGASIRPDWESVRVEVMRKAVLAKFSQHADLRELLLATGEATIVEHTEHDAFWGDGGDGSGGNMLGRILMEVRQILRAGVA